jgi:hypothetical protein
LSGSINLPIFLRWNLKLPIAISILVLLSAPLTAGVDFGVASQNVADQQDDMTKFFNSLSKERAHISPRMAGATFKAKRTRLSANIWQEALQDPYKKAEALKAAKGLAGIGLASVGSAMAGDMATQLLAAGTQMLATGDSQFASLGSTLKLESAAISSNNPDAAQTLAESVNTTPLPDLSSYNPTSSDTQYALATQQATAQIAGAVLTAVGTVAGAVIGAYASWGTGAVTGAMYGAALGNMAGNAVGGAIDGQPNNSLNQATNLGVQAINQGSQSTQNKAVSSINQAGQQTNSVQSGQSLPIGSSIGSAPTGNGPISPQASQSLNTGAVAGTGI